METTTCTNKTKLNYEIIINACRILNKRVGVVLRYSKQLLFTFKFLVEGTSARYITRQHQPNFLCPLTLLY